MPMPASVAASKAVTLPSHGQRLGPSSPWLLSKHWVSLCLFTHAVRLLATRTAPWPWGYDNAFHARMSSGRRPATDSWHRRCAAEVRSSGPRAEDSEEGGGGTLRLRVAGLVRDSDGRRPDPGAISAVQLEGVNGLLGLRSSLAPDSPQSHRVFTSRHLVRNATQHRSDTRFLHVHWEGPGY